MSRACAAWPWPWRLSMIPSYVPSLRSWHGAFRSRRRSSEAFWDWHTNAAPLTVALVRQSAIRAEEFARHFSMRLGIAIRGETGEKSLKRLNALDYRRLLSEAEQAKQAAQDQMERLRKKQEQTDRGRRRGKW